MPMKDQQVIREAERPETQQLALLKELAMRIHEDEKTLEGLLEESAAMKFVRSLIREPAL
jgi:hypothetical protein